MALCRLASLDGQTLFVQGPSETKRDWQLYAWNSGNGTLRRIGPEGIPDSIKLVSPDRTQILAVGPDERWWSYPVDGGEPRAINGLTEHDTPIAWRGDNRSIFVVMHHDENKMLHVSVLDIASGQKTPWKELRPSRPVDEGLPPKITPDGRAYAYNFRVKLSDSYVRETLFSLGITGPRDLAPLVGPILLGSM